MRRITKEILGVKGLSYVRRSLISTQDYFLPECKESFQEGSNFEMTCKGIPLGAVEAALLYMSTDMSVFSWTKVTFSVSNCTTCCL